MCRQCGGTGWVKGETGEEEPCPGCHGTGGDGDWMDIMPEFEEPNPYHGTYSEE